MMEWPTMQRILEILKRLQCSLVDLTGGTPELNPQFRAFVAALRSKGHNVQVRTNLTVLLEKGMEDLPEWLRLQEVHLVASLPCYLEENVRSQRGVGVYEKSVQALQRLNAAGYGREAGLALDLVYNPNGPFLPPRQHDLENDYRRELDSRHGISFTRLLTIANMPVGRFRAALRLRNAEAEYLKLLRDSFNPQTLDALMCRHQISIDWSGRLYDCDFNLALGQTIDHGAPNHIERFDFSLLKNRRIVTGDHCFGCTAGFGSSCGGALS